MQNDNVDPNQASNKIIEELKEQYRQDSIEDVRHMKMQTEYVIGKTRNKMQKNVVKMNELRAHLENAQLHLTAINEILAKADEWRPK